MKKKTNRRYGSLRYLRIAEGRICAQPTRPGWPAGQLVKNRHYTQRLALFNPKVYRFMLHITSFPQEEEVTS
jgi:hypothetical protein